MIDFIILTAFATGLLIGYRKGAVKQIGSLVSLFVAILACHFFGDTAADLAASLIGTGKDGVVSSGGYGIASFTGNAVLFFTVWLGFGLLTGFIHDFIKAIHLGPVNGVFGAVFMGFKVLLVASIVLNIWLAIEPDSPALKEGGPTTVFTTGIGPKILDVAKDNF